MIVAVVAGVVAWLILMPRPVVPYRKATTAQRMWRCRRRPHRRTVDVATVVAEIAMRLDAGQDVTAAWRKALEAGIGSRLSPRLSQRQLLRVLRHHSAPESASAIDSLQAAMAFSMQQGAPLSHVLGRIVGSLHEANEAARQRRVALAGPRASARILAFLPLAGVGLGMIVGANPLTVYVDGGWGTLSALAGIIFMSVGYLWNQRLTRHAQRAGEATVSKGDP